MKSDNARAIAQIVTATQKAKPVAEMQVENLKTLAPLAPMIQELLVNLRNLKALTPMIRELGDNLRRLDKRVAALEKLAKKKK